MQCLIHQAHRHGPPQNQGYDTDDDLELNMAYGAPDLASLLVYDYYPPARSEMARGESWADAEDTADYSILPHLFACLTSSLDE